MKEKFKSKQNNSFRTVPVWGKFSRVEFPPLRVSEPP